MKKNNADYALILIQMIININLLEEIIVWMQSQIIRFIIMKF